MAEMHKFETDEESLPEITYKTKTATLFEKILSCGILMGCVWIAVGALSVHVYHQFLSDSEAIHHHRQELARIKTELDIKRYNQRKIREQCQKSVIVYESAHIFVDKLASLLIDFYKRKQVKSIADLGCGQCDYVEILRKQNFEADGFQWTMFDTSEFITRINLSQKQNFGRKYDFVQTFEVGEHIYFEYQDNFLDNIANHAREGIVMSWAVMGQHGYMHVNNRDNEYIIGRMAERGFRYHPADSDAFREIAGAGFQHLMIFYRGG